MTHLNFEQVRKDYEVTSVSASEHKKEGVNMIDIMDAAHYLIYLSYHEKRGSLIPLKLQKLLYLAQG